MGVNGLTKVYATGPDNYSTTVLFRHAREVLAATSANQPLYLEVMPHAPHISCKSNAADEAVFAGYLHRPDSFREADISDKPLWVRNAGIMENGDVSAIDTSWRKCLATLLSVDRNLGLLLADYAAAGRDPRIIITSDNGYMWGEHNITNGKKCGYEECTGVPFIAVTPETSGTVDARLVSSLDWTSTVLSWAGATAPYQLEGMDLSPVLQGQNPLWRDALFVEWLGSQRPKFTLVREPGLVLVKYIQASQGNELYDLVIDPFQLVNRYNDPVYSADKQRLLDRIANR